MSLQLVSLWAIYTVYSYLKVPTLYNNIPAWQLGDDKIKKKKCMYRMNHNDGPLRRHPSAVVGHRFSGLLPCAISASKPPKGQIFHYIYTIVRYDISTFASSLERPLSIINNTSQTRTIILRSRSLGDLWAHKIIRTRDEGMQDRYILVI